VQPQTLVVVITPLLLSPLLFGHAEEGSDAKSSSRCAFVMLLMAAYWATEAMPLAVTAFLPAVLLPMLGVK
jgi:di/tricarboxylate transporter